MISGKDFYNILSALVPLYVVMILAYGAVRWWKIFNPEHCAGINRFVAMFSVPLLLFDFIANNDPYAMNHKFIVADSLQKVVILFVLFIWLLLSKWGSLDWVITVFSVATLPNTLIMGVPLLDAMYGEYSGKLMVQIVFMQCLVWYNVVLVLFEYRGAMTLISKKFPSTAGAISSFRVEPDVKSLNGHEAVDADAEINEDGNLYVNVRRSFSVNSYHKSINSFMSGGSNSIEIYGEQSFREPTPQGSSMEIHMFEWSSDAGEVSEGGQMMINGANIGRTASSDLRLPNASKASLQRHTVDSLDVDEMENASSDRAAKKGQTVDIGETPEMVGSVEEGVDVGKTKNCQMPPVHVLTKLILVMVWRRMIRIPNTYATVLGLFWSLIAFRFGFSLPKIISRSISILSTTGLGLSMFSLGLFLASQTNMISCGKGIATFATIARFLVGPAVAAATAAAVGLRGDLLRISVVQAALPLAIVPFVFAKEYNMHADIISTSVSFGMIIALPVTILYYVLMGL